MHVYVAKGAPSCPIRDPGLPSALFVKCQIFEGFPTARSHRGINKLEVRPRLPVTKQPGQKEISRISIYKPTWRKMQLIATSLSRPRPTLPRSRRSDSDSVIRAKNGTVRARENSLFFAGCRSYNMYVHGSTGIRAERYLPLHPAHDEERRRYVGGSFWKAKCRQNGVHLTTTENPEDETAEFVRGMEVLRVLRPGDISAFAIENEPSRRTLTWCP